MYITKCIEILNLSFYSRMLNKFKLLILLYGKKMLYVTNY